LRQLLAVEHRLQVLVRAARGDAGRRIAEARAARDLRLEAAREEAERAAAEQARLERAAHEKALAVIDAAHRAAIAAITHVSDSRVDELARWALSQAIASTGEPA
jgi:vacuolar-type H+-ATPase subunit H